MEAIKVGDRVRHVGEPNLVGTVMYSSHGVEFEVKWDGNGTALVRNVNLEKVE